ncbi:hypothetical protein [Pseudomonas lini]
MGAETVTCAKGNSYNLQAEHTLTDKKDVSEKTVPVESTKAIVFFVGGAGDKESYYFSGPFRNVQDAQSSFNKRTLCLCARHGALRVSATSLAVVAKRVTWR